MYNHKPGMYHCISSNLDWLNYHTLSIISCLLGRNAMVNQYHWPRSQEVEVSSNVYALGLLPCQQRNNGNCLKILRESFGQEDNQGGRHN